MPLDDRPGQRERLAGLLREAAKIVRAAEDLVAPAAQQGGPRDVRAARAGTLDLRLEPLHIAPVRRQAQDALQVHAGGFQEAPQTPAVLAVADAQGELHAAGPGRPAMLQEPEGVVERPVRLRGTAQRVGICDDAHPHTPGRPAFGRRLV